MAAFSARSGRLTVSSERGAIHTILGGMACFVDNAAVEWLASTGSAIPSCPDSRPVIYKFARRGRLQALQSFDIS